MVDKRIGEAVLIVVVLGEVVLAKRLGLLRADSRGWHTCLYFAVSGAVLLACLDLLEFGFTDALSFASLVLVVVGAMAGALTGLMLSFFARREPG